MRVTFVALNYAPSVGGAQEHVRRVAEGLVGLGHDVEVLTTDALLTPAAPDAGRVSQRREVLGGVGVTRFPVARRAHDAHRALRRIDRRFRPDVVRGDGGRVHPLAVGPFAGRLALAVRRAHRSRDAVVACSAPFLTLVAPIRLRGRGDAASIAMPLLHLRPDGPHPWVAAALRRVDAVTASTPDERDALVGLGVDPAVVSVIPPGTDPAAFPDLDRPSARRSAGLPERPTIGYVGRLAPHKGIDTLLAAAALLWARRPETNVLVAGAPGSWSGFEPLVAALRPVAGDRLIVREGFADEDRATLLASCDVVATPSREESFGMVAIEAWAARRPVVAADVPAVRSVVRDGVDGTLVAVDDPAGLADALDALLADPAEAAARGRAGRARVEAELAWDVVVADWDELLHGAVARRRVRRAGRVGR